MSDESTIRLLYFVGAGPAAMVRVDIAHLFGKRLTAKGLVVDWYLRSPDVGGPLTRGVFHGQPARLCGRSPIDGPFRRVIDKCQESVATLHFGLSALTGKHDVIQVRDAFAAGLLGLLAAKFKRRPFAFWLSYPYPEAKLQDAREGRARFPLFARVSGGLSSWVLYRWLIRRADIVFVQSEQMKRDLMRPGVEPARLITVPMGVPDDEIPPQTSLATESLVLYLGTLARVRRLSMIIDAFARVHTELPAARLVIVGDGDVPEDRAELERAVARHGVGDAVVFTGQLPRQEALAWVQRAAVCLSPFYPTFVLRSTSPTKLVEYMASARPVVANDHPEQADVVAASGGGLCVPWDAEPFAQAMLLLLRDSELRASMGAAGRDWVLRHRRYSVVAETVLQQYRKLTAKGTSADEALPNRGS